MLTAKERHQILVLLGRFSKLNFFPIQVDPQSWEIQPGCASELKTWACKLAYALFMAHTLYKALSLVYVLLFLRGIPLYQNIIHGIMAGCAMAFVLWQYVLYWRDVDVNAAFVKMSLTGISARVTYPKRMNFDDRKAWYGRLAERSRQDLIAIFLPHMLILTMHAFVACYVLDPTMKMLLYSAIPAKHKNWLWFGICLLEEIRYLVVFLATVVPVWQVQIVAFELVNYNLELILKSLLLPQSNGGNETGDIYQRLRSIQLYMTTVNIVNRYLIFAWKILSIGMCITSGYAAIAHFNDHPVFGVMYYALFIDSALIYMMLYEKAFKVPERFSRAKSLLTLRATGMRNGLERKVVGRQAMSIQPVGIKVGEFHTMERLSTPIFLHYVLNNVVSMLVAYG